MTTHICIFTRHNINIIWWTSYLRFESEKKNPLKSSVQIYSWVAITLASGQLTSSYRKSGELGLYWQVHKEKVGNSANIGKFIKKKRGTRPTYIDKFMYKK